MRKNVHACFLSKQNVDLLYDEHKYSSNFFKKMGVTMRRVLTLRKSSDIIRKHNYVSGE